MKELTLYVRVHGLILQNSLILLGFQVSQLIVLNADQQVRLKNLKF